MNKLSVKVHNKTYPVIIDDSFSNLGASTGTLGRKATVITDHNVGGLYMASLLSDLKDYCAEVYIFSLEPGEESKCLKKTQEIYRFLQDRNFCRNDFIISLGGGVIGDIAGFAASTYLRGIRFIQIPSSLLAQADSCIGGKNAVNFGYYKNIIGTYYQPDLVFINYTLLQTLPKRQIKNGLVEIIVHSLISNVGLFEYLEDNIADIFNWKKEQWEYVIYTNCRIKAEIVEADEQDSGIRKFLNLGHTFGHAIEGASNFLYNHGECVAIGIAAAFCISKTLNLLNNPDLPNRVNKIFEAAGIQTTMKGLNVEKVVSYMEKDKKAENGQINLILPADIGEIYLYTLQEKEILFPVLENLIL